MTPPGPGPIKVDPAPALSNQTKNRQSLARDSRSSIGTLKLLIVSSLSVFDFDFILKKVVCVVSFLRTSSPHLPASIHTRFSQNVRTSTPADRNPLRKTICGGGANPCYRNSTLTGAPVTYADYFNDIAAYNVHLNVFEKAWAAWYAYMQNDVLATGIMSFMMHEIVYFGRALPFLIMDKIPYFKKYKIQAVCPWKARIEWLLRADKWRYSTKCPRLPNNGPAQDSSSSPISPSNSPRSGSSTQHVNFSVFRHQYRFLLGTQWSGKSLCSSSSKMHGIIGFTGLCTRPNFTR